MKKIVYQIKGHIVVYNPDSGQNERRETIARVETEYTEASVELAKSEAYNGEYTIEEG